MDVNYILLRILVFTSIALLIVGWRKRTTIGHTAAMAGWLLFGLFWLLTIPHFLEKDEPVNAIYCFLGFPLFLFILYHEHLSIRWGDDPDSLSFMAGTVGMSAGMYFMIDTFPQVAGFFVWLTAIETAGFLSLFGYEARAGGISYDDIVRVPIFHGEQRGISIILACTAIQSIVIFIAAIWTTRVKQDPMKIFSFRVPTGLATLFGYEKTERTYKEMTTLLSRKWAAFLITVPIILLLNIVRTAAVIYLVYEGHVDFEMAHNWLSRWGSMFVLIVLAYIMFDLLPELHDNIVGIPLLVKRKIPENRDT